MDNKAKVILICGKLCSGKSTYAEKIRKQQHAVVLSCDEITLGLFDGDLGTKHDAVVARTKEYLLNKSLEILEIGTNIILEWGFWRKTDRDSTRTFYESRDIVCEMHYVEISDALWRENIMERNQKIMSENASAYFVDDGLMEKFNSIFEVPDQQEIDFWYTNDRG